MKIEAIVVEAIQVDCAAARLAVRLSVNADGQTYELRGRIVGPSCVGRSIVEIAYPLKFSEKKDSTHTFDCTIPEPNLWSEQSPFAYAIEVELFVGGRSTHRRTSPLLLRGR